MQTTSQTYKTLVAADNHWFETKLKIWTGVSSSFELDESQIMSASVSRPGMSEAKPSVGGALSATLDCTFQTPQTAIPKMAKIEAFFRVTNRATPETTVTNANTSAWYPSGTFFIDTRSVSAGDYSITDITAYDAMMLAEQDYPDAGHDWPELDTTVVSEIASTIGVTVDSRTFAIDENTGRITGFLTCGYLVDLPADGSMREVLENIAGMYGGNFVVTQENKLLFVPLYGLEPETNLTGEYLACENTEGNRDKALTFGGEGWYILV